MKISETIKKIFIKIKNEKGISLVELVVAVSIFSSVVIAVSGIFISALKTQKTIAAKQNVADDMRYIMEFMIKEIRMAQVVDGFVLTFNDGEAVPSQVRDGRFSKISFKNASSDTIVYEFDSVNNKILRSDSSSAAGYQDLSSGKITITGLSFSINAWDLVNGPAPVISILIKGEDKSGVGGEIQLQNSVSPRIY